MNKVLIYFSLFLLMLLPAYATTPTFTSPLTVTNVTSAGGVEYTYTADIATPGELVDTTERLLLNINGQFTQIDLNTNSDITANGLLPVSDSFPLNFNGNYKVNVVVCDDEAPADCVVANSSVFQVAGLIDHPSNRVLGQTTSQLPQVGEDISGFLDGFGGPVAALILALSMCFSCIVLFMVVVKLRLFGGKNK